MAHEIAHVTQHARAARRSNARRRTACRSCWRCSARSSVAPGSERQLQPTTPRMAAMAVGAGADGAAADRLHALQRSRGRPHRHPHPGAQRLRPGGMAGFFERMQAHARSNQGGDRERTPDYLQTHPVTTTRISEAKRARRAAAGTPSGHDAPGGHAPNGSRERRAIRSAARQPAAARHRCACRCAGSPSGGSGQFDWARERLRVLSADTPDAGDRANTSACAARRQAQRRAALRPGPGAPATATRPRPRPRELTPLLEKHPGNMWLALALGRGRSPQRQGRRGRRSASRRCCDRMPQQPRGGADLRPGPGRARHAATPASARRRCCGRCWPARRRPGVPADLRPRQRTGRRSRPRRRSLRRGRLPERPPRTGAGPAQHLKKRDDLDYYARARIDARIAADHARRCWNCGARASGDPDVDRR